MTRRDPRHRDRRYAGAVGRRSLFRWTIWSVRALAVPTALVSLFLVLDVMLPATVEDGIVYRRTADSRWVGPDGILVDVGWPGREGCLEQRDDGRRLLFAERPGCSGRVGVPVALGRDLVGGDTLRVLRTPVFERVRAVEHSRSGHRADWYPLFNIGLFVLLGFVPLLSLRENFAVYSIGAGTASYHLVYVLPALAAEVLYVWLCVGALFGT